jgi:DNA-directed RNA polymerase beta subunit
MSEKPVSAAERHHTVTFEFDDRSLVAVRDLQAAGIEFIGILLNGRLILIPKVQEPSRHERS